jgi:hypothetical protein
MQHQPADTYLNSRQVRERYGHASDMWLWRRLNEDGGKFPKPLIIRRRRFWRLNEPGIEWNALPRNQGGNANRVSSFPCNVLFGYSLRPTLVLSYPSRGFPALRSISQLPRLPTTGAFLCTNAARGVGKPLTVFRFLLLVGHTALIERLLSWPFAR